MFMTIKTKQIYYIQNVCEITQLPQRGISNESPRYGCAPRSKTERSTQIYRDLTWLFNCERLSTETRPTRARLRKRPYSLTEFKIAAIRTQNSVP